MASRSGRRGAFSPVSKELLSKAIFNNDNNEDYNTPSGPNQRHNHDIYSIQRPLNANTTYFLAEAKRCHKASCRSDVSEILVSDSSSSKLSHCVSIPISGKANSQPEEGCRACGKDDDHANLLLCEACNDEYHTYCLKPPLQSVPEGDFFCVKCKGTHTLNDDDGLDSLVSALPPSFTSRFGEIIWAAGGVGFGWWPACIYDPRLTVGGARQLARKHLGKKHLIYFFECDDAPFTVLSGSKIAKWEEGFLEEYDLGRVARSGSKSRTSLFERALHIAMIENGKPMELRLDWNHQGSNQPNQPKPRPGNAMTALTSQRQNKKPKPLTVGSIAAKEQSSDQNIYHHQPFFSSMSMANIQPYDGRQTLAVNRKNIEAALRKVSSFSTANAIEPIEDRRLVCKVLKKLPLVFPPSGGGELVSEGMEFSINLGFLTLPSRYSATFACIRQAIENDFDDDCFQESEPNREQKIKWKFYVPKLGPVNVKQEAKIGSVLEFLRSTTDDAQLGNGTASSPLKVIVMDC